jgi:hypothetical protein
MVAKKEQRRKERAKVSLKTYTKKRLDIDMRRKARK